MFGASSIGLDALSWTNKVVNLQTVDPVIEGIVTVLGISLTAKQNNDTQLAVRGLQVYNHAIRKLKIAISSPRYTETGGLLAVADCVPFMKPTLVVEVSINSQTRSSSLATQHTSTGNFRFIQTLWTIFKRARSPLEDRKWLISRGNLLQNRR
ncbi:hypothetical protein VHEMI00837 [[Torrubiella] hemipterigena]|uniref:Uncharacterized protein n=1 Tax=[Torrubiella] hemipterigena TaxID=1531966 RepID=A0A0A1SRJ9_9HYPO|nr:hypothetical protein VHEMI00837 [[Torrubiella] hemipterigena]